MSEHTWDLAQDPAQDSDPDHNDPKALLPDALPDLELEPEEEDELDHVLCGQHCSDGDRV